jgi:hypothetical protein
VQNTHLNESHDKNLLIRCSAGAHTSVIRNIIA